MPTSLTTLNLKALSYMFNNKLIARNAFTGQLTDTYYAEDMPLDPTRN